MSAVKSVYMVERLDGDGYRKVFPEELRRMLERQVVTLEGVDGDEEANTVTYWYRRLVAGVDV